MEKELHRDIEDLFKKRLFNKKKISILYGPRQAGKTTFVQRILKEYNGDPKTGYYTCESGSVKEILQSGSVSMIHQAFSGPKVIAFDEAQKIKNIGQILKLLIDEYPDMTIIATGSSSFDLANKLNEPLTGRHNEYYLYPFSLNEIKDNYSFIELQDKLNEIMIYGSYPEIYLSQTLEDKVYNLDMLSHSYLYKDIFEDGSIRNPEVLNKILQALAFQVGGEVSYSEIASLVGVDKKTVMSYIRLLEQAFIIFRLPPLGNNMRNEIKKMPKFYFYDNGVLNALLNNYNGGDTRDMGPLWENLMISERRKYNQLRSPYRDNSYYWRLTSGHEVDYIESYEGKLHPYEFKYRKNKLEGGATKFQEYYGEPVQLINKDNYMDFVLLNRPGDGEA